MDPISTMMNPQLQELSDLHLNSCARLQIRHDVQNAILDELKSTLPQKFFSSISRQRPQRDDSSLNPTSVVTVESIMDDCKDHDSLDCKTAIEKINEIAARVGFRRTRYCTLSIVLFSPLYISLPLINAYVVLLNLSKWP